MTQMMPPALPGYPAPAAAYPAPPPAYAQPAGPAYPPPGPPAPAHAPQGYPGPAVAAPVPAPAPPPPQGQPYPAYAQPAPQAPPQYAQPQPQPGYPPQQYAQQPAPQQPQQIYAPSSPGDIGAAIAAATGGDRAEVAGPGNYLFEILETTVAVNPVDRRLTLKARFKILASDNPSFPVGAEAAYIEGLQWGAGRIQEFLIGASGYPSKAVFDQAMAGAGRDPKVELEKLGNAVGNSQVQQPGNHYPANPLAGRRVGALVTQQTKIAGERSAKRGQQVTYTNFRWSPAA